MNDRNRLIRLASTLPVGSPRRRAILAGIVAPDTVRAKRAGVLEDSVMSALKGGGVTGTPAIKSFQVTNAGIVALVEAQVVLPATPAMTRAVLPALPPEQVAQAIVDSPVLLADLSPATAALVPFGAFPASSFKNVMQTVLKTGLSKYSDEVLRALVEGRKGYIGQEDEIEGYSPQVSDLTTQTKSMVKGANVEQYFVDHEFEFAVKNGILTIVLNGSLVWENHTQGLTVKVPMEEPVVLLSMKVYPTKKDVLDAFPQGFAQSPDTYGKYWSCRPNLLPKGTPGVHYISAHINNAAVVKKPLASSPRSVLEQLVHWVAEATA